MTREQLINLTLELQHITGVQLKTDSCCYAFGYPMFDYYNFEDKLKMLYPDEYKENMSMQQFLTQKYGKRVVEIVEQLINNSKLI
ncbi:hypothetical protein [Capnocytophaga leadbetteri]|uniref:hypothetical protein n=1 Tax=Capnocytophaga leadbetteri TaxID=327575 RepID=UPI0026EAE10C|nr:hypothetical protein [Capnocytophaga leadbetteri]